MRRVIDRRGDLDQPSTNRVDAEPSTSDRPESQGQSDMAD